MNTCMNAIPTLINTSSSCMYQVPTYLSFVSGSSSVVPALVCSILNQFVNDLRSNLIVSIEKKCVYRSKLYTKLF